jgi:hypothetical protein
MNETDVYIDLDGQSIALDQLSTEERALFEELSDFARRNPDWAAFHNFWLPKVHAFYSAAGRSRAEIVKAPLWRLAQDLSGRLGLASGEIRPADYRDELEELVRTRFRTRREFCEATGLSEDMLSHVLARRKHLAIDTLSEALEKVGYTIHITPLVR